MYKNKMIIASILTIFIFAFSIFDFYQTNEFVDLLNQELEEKNKLQKLKNLSLNMKTNNFMLPKSIKKVFKMTPNSKEFIEKASDYFSLHKVLFKNKFSNSNFYKQEELNLKFSCKNEQQIYKFLQHLYLDIGGLVIFEKIKIQKNDNQNFSAEINCKIFSYLDCYKKYVTISEKEKYYPIKKWIHLFDYEKEKYVLNGVMEHCIAFINNVEKKVGDEVGEYEILKIKDSEIELSRRENLKTIHVGENF